MALLPSFPDVHFGYGALAELAPELLKRGIDRPLIITDVGVVKHGICRKVCDALAGRAAVFDGIPENPTIAGVERSLEAYQAGGCNGIVALGGGSVLDSGKALRILAHQGGNLLDYLKDPSRIGKSVAPYITIPTTAGTGAEVTFGGGIHPAPNAPALGIRSPYARPDLAICDPELTLSLPPRLTAATGMDALTHCVEGFLSTRINPPTQAVALDGIARLVGNVGRATADGQDREARSQMLMAALEGGMSIYMGLGPIHALSMAFSDSPLHHGTLVTVVMPAVMRFYNGMEGGKLQSIARAMSLKADGDAGNRIADAVAQMNAGLGLPASVRQMGYEKRDIDRMVDDAHRSYFNLTAPRQPSREDYQKLVTEVLG
jgi:4-hydroxybutyrate dehydrogenase